METVTVAVASANGSVVNEGVVAIQVDGQTVFAPVVNGMATATVATSLFDLNVLIDLFFPHLLTATYTDSSGTFTGSSAFDTVPAILWDFFMAELALQLVF